MTCFHPLTAYRAVGGGVVFRHDQGISKLELPCGQCIGCRLERSRQWAMRCVHEASLYEQNCFITLTYDEENLPSDGSLNLSHWQDFMKRLRARFQGSGRRIRFFHCGEYGEICEQCEKSRPFCRCGIFRATFGRPHFHACVFNFDFGDKVLFEERDGCRTYTSATLESLWTFGHSLVGSVTFESAAYVARYVMKKVVGGDADHHYMRVNGRTGELTPVKPEYTTMSRRPGIGRGWYERFKGEVVRDDNVIIREMAVKPPRFYDRILGVEDPDTLARLKDARKRRALKFRPDQTADRLAVRERVKEAQCRKLKRRLENGS